MPGWNSPFAVYGELITKRLNVSLLNNVFPGQLTLPLGFVQGLV